MNLSNYYDYKKLSNERERFKKIFFYRICGTGMGACAHLMASNGIEVAGYDSAFYPPMGPFLKSAGITLYDQKSFNLDLIKNYDLIVVGNVVSGKSQEARDLEELGVPFCSFPAALGEFVLKGRHVVGIAGTHGKTTTTYLATQVFQNLGFDVGYFIGGIVDKGPSVIGSCDYFFIESDEYDSAYFEKYSKFQSYHLKSMILTSLEFDHADIFESLTAISKEFTRVFQSMNGVLISNSNYPEICTVRKQYQGKQFHYNSDVGPKITEQTSTHTDFELKFGDHNYKFTTNLLGKHNIENLSGVITFALSQDIAYEKILDAIKSLRMVKRRQEVRGTYRGAVVIDDFAHHPRAVEVTIESIRQKYPSKNIIALLEPKSATARSDIFQSEFVQALSYADEVVLLNSNLATTVKDRGNLNFEKVANDLKQKFQKKAVVANNLDQLRSAINDSVLEGTVLLFMSNNTCLGLWESEFVKELH